MKYAVFKFRILWSTVSKAFDKSRNIAMVSFLWSIAVEILSYNLIKANEVERSVVEMILLIS